MNLSLSSSLQLILNFSYVGRLPRRKLQKYLLLGRDSAHLEVLLHRDYFPPPLPDDVHLLDYCEQRGIHSLYVYGGPPEHEHQVLAAGLADLELLELPVSEDARGGNGARVPVTSGAIREAGVIAQPRNGSTCTFLYILIINGNNL